MGCGANETHIHYLHCTDEGMIKYQESRLKILNQELRKIKTYDGIRIILMTILRHGLTHPDIITKHHCASDQLIEMAINEQKKIGEDMIGRGFLSKRWKQAQQQWENQQNNWNDEWEVKLVQSLLEYSYSLWKKRNEHLHGKSLKENKINKQMQLLEQTCLLYERDRSALTMSERRHFSLPLQQRLKRGNQHLQTWIQLVELIFETSNGDQQKNY